MLADHDLARRLEWADAAGAVDFVRAHAGRHPDAGAAFTEVCGGQVVFAGPDSPVTQAIALGMDGPVTPDAIDRVESFLSSRGAMVHIEVCPHADGSLLKVLNERHYALAQHSNMLICELSPSSVGTRVADEVTVRPVDESRVDEWVRAIASGFFRDEDVPPSVYDDIRTFYEMSTSTCFLAAMGSEVVGGGVVAIHERLASLFGHSTHPAFRNRGVQSSVIAPSLELARSAGCDLAASCTLPGSISQRNLERSGFRVAYTRSRMVARR